MSTSTRLRYASTRLIDDGVLDANRVPDNPLPAVRLLPVIIYRFFADRTMEFLRVPAVRTQISDERYSPCFCLQSSCSVNRGPSALNSRCSCLGGGGEVFDSLRKPYVFGSWIAPVFDERYRHSSRLVRRTPSIPTNGRPCL